MSFKIMHFFILLHILSLSSWIEGVVLVSLGGDCTVASVMRDLKLRKAAYPFDWMFSEFDALYATFKDNFKNFLKYESLKVDDTDKRIITDFYGLRFVHDFPTINHNAALNDSETHEWATIRHDWQEFIPAIRQKYLRRIQRLQRVLHGSEPVFLIRYSMNKDEAIKMRDLLLAEYPQLDFTIIAVTGDGNSEDWQLTRIKHFAAIYGSPSFKSAWKNIFSTLGVTPENTRFMHFDEEDDDCELCDGTCKRITQEYSYNEYCTYYYKNIK